MQTTKPLKMSCSVLVSSTLLCGTLTVSQAAPTSSCRSFDRLVAPQNFRLVDEDSDRADRDIAEAVDDAYVYYVSQVKGFDPHYYGVPQVKQEAAQHAAKIEAILKANPQYRARKVGTFVRNESVQMTVEELMNNLNQAEQIIRGDKAETQARNMSYFTQGDVDDWKNRTARLDAKDGFILLANNEYSLLFNRAQGERQLLTRYSKGNGGQMLPNSVIAPLHNQISNLLAKMNASARLRSFSGGHNPVEPSILGFIKRQAPHNIPGAKVVKVSWSNNPWLIDKNVYGVPVLRRRMGTVLYRVPNLKYGVEQHFFYHETYAGGGRYQRGTDINFADLRFVKF